MSYDVTHNQDGTISVSLPDGDELRIVVPIQQEPYCWTWDEWISGGRWRAEYGWKKPERQVTNLQPLFTRPQNNQWEGLTDSNKVFLIRSSFENSWTKLVLIEEVEQMLRHKNDK